MRAYVIVTDRPGAVPHMGVTLRAGTTLPPEPPGSFEEWGAHIKQQLILMKENHIILIRLDAKTTCWCRSHAAQPYGGRSL